MSPQFIPPSSEPWALDDYYEYMMHGKKQRYKKVSGVFVGVGLQEGKKTLHQNEDFFDPSKLFSLTQSPAPQEKPLIGFYGHYTDTIKLLEQTPKRPENHRNKEEIVLSDANASWAGGTLFDAKNLPDMDFFKSAKERFSKLGLQRKIIPQISINNRRKRLKNEYDGDFNFDDKWQMRPFDTAKRQPVLVPHITILADFSFNAHYESSLLNDYGAFVWSICQILESAGISITIFLRLYSHGLTIDGNDMNAKIKIKSSNEYISPIAMAHCFRSVFYRKVLFNLYILAPDNFGLVANMSLGRGAPYSDNILYEEGELKLSIGAMTDIESVEREILKILETKKRT